MRRMWLSLMLVVALVGASLSAWSAAVGTFTKGICTTAAAPDDTIACFQ